MKIFEKTLITIGQNSIYTLNLKILYTKLP